MVITTLPHEGNLVHITHEGDQRIFGWWAKQKFVKTGAEDWHSGKQTLVTTLEALLEHHAASRRPRPIANRSRSPFNITIGPEAFEPKKSIIVRVNPEYGALLRAYGCYCLTNLIGYEEINNRVRIRLPGINSWNMMLGVAAFEIAEYFHQGFLLCDSDGNPLAE